ncbi:MAG: hypothetical protein LUD72_11205 [Bacteroidales bacterium]|nr:hypothetical protein [Bacteroidales bacterium]
MTKKNTKRVIKTEMDDDFDIENEDIINDDFTIINGVVTLNPKLYSTHPTGNAVHKK